MVYQPITGWRLVNMWMPLGLKLLSVKVILKLRLKSQSHWIAFENIFFLRCSLKNLQYLLLPLAASAYMIRPCVIACSLSTDTFWEKPVKKISFFYIKGAQGSHTSRRLILGLKQDKLPRCKRVGNCTGGWTTEPVYCVLENSRLCTVVYLTSS